MGGWSLAVFVFFVSIPFSYAGNHCQQNLNSDISVERLYHQEPIWRDFYEPDFYAADDLQNILVLGSRPSVLERPSLTGKTSIPLSRGTIADRIHGAFPHKRVVSADLTVKASRELEPGYWRVKIDHTQPFPEASDTYDAIVARRTLCLCGSKKRTCGGIRCEVDAAVQFFSETLRVLNKRNPNAFVMLHGRPWRDHDVAEKIWAVAAAEIMRRYPVHAILHYNAQSERQAPTFIALEFRPLP